MLRISKMTDYGVLLMAQMARAPEQVYNAAELAAQLRMTVHREQAAQAVGARRAARLLSGVKVATGSRGRRRTSP